MIQWEGDLAAGFILGSTAGFYSVAWNVSKPLICLVSLQMFSTRQTFGVYRICKRLAWLSVIARKKVLIFIKRYGMKTFWSKYETGWVVDPSTTCSATVAVREVFLLALVPQWCCPLNRPRSRPCLANFLITLYRCMLLVKSCSSLVPFRHCSNKLPGRSPCFGNHVKPLAPIHRSLGYQPNTISPAIKTIITLIISGRCLKFN